MSNTATATGTIEHVDPMTIVIDQNVRTDPSIEASFVDSVRTGVRTPVLAYLDTDGTITVTDGQRRTLAAREAGLATIPAYVVTRDQALSDDDQTVERITDQVITNEQRTALSRRDRAKAIEQLHLAGLSPTKIAKRLSQKKKEVDHTLAVAKSDNALDGLDEADLDLEQAATLASWDADREAITKLLDAATRGRFDHVAAALEAEREDRALMRAEGETLTAEGIAWTMSRPAMWDGLDPDRTARSRRQRRTGHPRRLPRRPHPRLPRRHRGRGLDRQRRPERPRAPDRLVTRRRGRRRRHPRCRGRAARPAHPHANTEPLG